MAADEFDEAPELDSDDFDDSVEKMLDYLKDKVPMLAEEFYVLEANARLRAFTVSGVAELDLVADVWNAIESAIKNGETLSDFRERIGEKLEDAWGGEDPARLDTIFRTNVQTYYSVGRFERNNSEAARQTHPFTRYDVVDDDRTSDICEALIGTILPSDDPFVLSHQPPLHFGCRTDAVAISEEEAREDGIDEEAPHVTPDDGFGDLFAEWEPDMSTRPAELVNLYELKNAGARA